MPKKTTPSAQAAPDFETALKELESVVAALEQGDISLDAALKHFERGVTLTRVCQQALTEAEQKVEVLLKDGSVEPFSPAEFEE
ncbi:MAG TPA: exodeoxyribonuclease VII small subunit [Gammaproteobacteria bacterium]|nr:exodeoxyribonuclease VII small subunit [Gammaproteobacteria bacterium]